MTLDTVSTGKSLDIHLNGALSGRLDMDKNGHMAFQYVNDRARMISLSLPVAAVPYRHKAVLPFVLGLLPDNEWITKSWAKSFGVSTHPFMLLKHIGADCAGAIRFLIPGAGDPHGPSGVDFLDDDEIEHALATARHVAGGRSDLRQAGAFSLAGAQAKIAVFQNGPRMGIARGHMPSTHICKPTAILDGHAENEHFCLRLAARMGLTVAQSDVIQFGAETAFVTERYDRVLLNPKEPLSEQSWLRIHQEDLCQAMGVLPSHKYQSDGGPSPESIAAFLKAKSSAPEEDLNRFADALVFNWLVAGTDGHAKNYALLHLPGGTIRLAPLYDIASARPYPHIHRPDIALSMRVGGTSHRNGISRERWNALWTGMGLDATKRAARLDEMLAQFKDAVQATADELHQAGLRHPVVTVLADNLIRDHAHLALLARPRTGARPAAEHPEPPAHEEDTTPVAPFSASKLASARMAFSDFAPGASGPSGKLRP